MDTLLFRHLMDTLVETFGIIYTSGALIINFLISPLQENMGDEFASVLGDIVYLTPIELMFGTGLFLALIYSLVKFFFPLG